MFRVRSGLAGLTAGLAACALASLADGAAASAIGGRTRDLTASMDVRGGVPVLQVLVNGRGPLRLGLDTGAMGGVYLFNGRAERLGLRATGVLGVSDPSGGPPRRLSAYGRAAVALAGGVFEAEVAGSPSAGPGTLGELDGLLGLAAFGQALVTLDFPHARLTVGAPGLPPPDGRQVFGYGGSLPMLPLEVEGRRIQAYLDTGDIQAGVIVPAEVAGRLAGWAQARPMGVAYTINAARPMFSVALQAPARVGTTTLAVSEAAFPGFEANGVVGPAALRQLVVRIDTLNRRIQLIPGERDNPTPGPTGGRPGEASSPAAP